MATFFILLNLILFQNVAALLEPQIIVDYFKIKYVGKLVIFSCENKYVQANLSNFLQNNNLYTTTINLKTINVDANINLESKINKLGFVIDTDCENNVYETLDECGNQRLFEDKYPWLIFSSNENVTNNILEDIKLFVNAEITVAFLNKLEEKWILTDVYNPGYGKGGTLKQTNIGTWNKFTRLNLNQVVAVPKYLRRKDLSEITLSGIISLVYHYPEDPWDYLLNNDSFKTVDNFSRYYFLLFHHVKDMHNFTLALKLTNIYGSMDKDGNFNGLVGYLQRKEIDVGLTPIYCKLDRLPYVDFLVPTYLMRTRFIFRHPKPALTIRGAFFSPLSNVVWICTWGVMLLTAFIIRVSFQQECNILEKNYNNYMEHDWSYISLLIFGGICQQDVPRVPNLYSGRTVVFTSVLFTYMLYQFYSGGIVSSLLSDPPKSIRDARDLLYSTLQIGVEDVIYERDYFEQTNDPIAIGIYKAKLQGKKNGSQDAFYDAKTGMEFVRKGGFAFQVDTSIGYEIITEEYSNEIICELGEVQLFPAQHTIGVIQQDLPYRELLLNSFQRMVEAGLIHAQRLRWTTRKPECIKIADSSTIYAGFNEFFPALLFYLVGVVITLIIFTCEIFCHRKQMSCIPKKRHFRIKI